MGVFEQLTMENLFGDVQRMDKRQVSYNFSAFRKRNLN